MRKILPSTGCDNLDQDHRQLFTAAMLLKDSIQLHQPETAKRLALTLFAMADEHHTEEDAYFRSRNSPWLRSILRLHERLLMLIEHLSLCLDRRDDAAAAQDAAAILATLEEWIANDADAARFAEREAQLR